MLVQIKPGLEKRSPLASLERPREIVELVEALTRMFGRVGMHKVCQKCFKRELPPEAGQNGGCCGGCELLGPTSCLNKPIWCATWMCRYTKRLFPATTLFISHVNGILEFLGNFNWYYRASGLRYESGRRFTVSEKRLLHALRHAVDAWEEPASAPV